MNQRKIGIVLSYLSIGINTTLRLLYVPLLLRYLGTNEFGIYQLVAAIIAYFSIMEFGLTATITRYYTKYSAKQDSLAMENLLAHSVMLYGIVTGVIVLFGAIIYSQLGPIFVNSLTGSEVSYVRQIFLVFLMNVILTVNTNLFTAVINAHEQFAFMRLLTIGQSLFEFVAVAAVIAASPTALSLILVQTLMIIIAAGIRIYYCTIRLKMKLKYHGFDWRIFSTVGRFSGTIFIQSVADQIFWKTNQIILGVVSGVAAVATYAIAAQVYMSYMALSTVIPGVFLPKVTKMVAAHADTKEYSALFIRNGRLQFLVLACVLSGFILFGKEFIHVWAGRKFTEAYLIALCILIPFTIDLIQNTGLVIMLAQNRYGFRAKAYCCIGIVNIALAIPLAFKYGAIGCATASGLIMLIGNGIIMNSYYARVLHLEIKAFWMKMAQIFSVAMLCCFIGSILNYLILGEGGIHLLIKIALYLLIYSMLMWRWAMNQYEKNLILSFLQRLKEILGNRERTLDQQLKSDK